MKNKKLLYLTQSAMIAAIYAALTLICSAWSFTANQLRVSEALTILPIFTPCAIPGLTIGCFLSNLASPVGVLDCIFGTLATLLAALCTRALRNIRIRKIPFLAPLPPVVFNAVIVGALISYTMPEGFTVAAFIASGLSVGLGELIVCYVFGIPLALGLEKSGLSKKIFHS